MINIEIPGRGDLRIKHAFFDYNGTLAVDGNMSMQVKARLTEMSQFVNVYILTADTYGTVTEECQVLDVKVETFPKDNAGLEKKKIVESYGGSRSVAVGNGFNDIEMFKVSALTCAVIEGEGCSGKLLTHADLVYKNIMDAFAALENPDRIKAGLRS